jgi:DNA polymerase-3 subunit delta'
MTMAWGSLEGHDAIAERFRRGIERGRLASSYLFVGPPGVGKRTFALRLAQALLCERRSEAELNPCEHCPSCHQVLADTHPDVEYVSLPSGKSTLPIELFVGDREHRSQEGFCHRISLRPGSGRRRVGIIDDADCFNQESANCLLKTLEEPPRKSLLILIGTSLQRQLPTIRSRCQVVLFPALPDSLIKQYLLEAGLCQGDDQADRAAEMAEGSLHRAVQFADPDLRQFGDDLAVQWSQPNPDTTAIAKGTQAFVDAAGVERTSRRDRLRNVIQWKIAQLRHEMVRLVSSPAAPPDAKRRPPLDIADRRLDRCLVALQQVDANANLATLIECWVDDLGQSAWRPARITHAAPERRSARSVSGPSG